MSLGRKLSIIALLYVIEGFPMGVYRSLWPVYFRREEMSLGEVGLLNGFILFWSLKVLWSPLVDRFGEQRAWICACLLVMTAGLLALPGIDASRLGPALLLACAAFCAASATQDIAIDAYTIGLVDRGQEGPANSMRITAYRAGMIASGGAGLLVLADAAGFDATFFAGGALTLALAASVFVCPRLATRELRRETNLAWLRRWAARPGVWAVAAFILLYRVGDIAMGPMVNTFWVDRGFSNTEIGVISGTVGVIVFVFGAWIGGAVVARFGIARSLWVLGALALLSNLGYVVAALLPDPLRYSVYAASIVESLCAGLASNAFMSFLMNISEKHHAAVQYALLTALYALPGTLAATLSGFLTEQVGYAAYFALTGALALPAFAFLPRAQRWVTPGA